MTTHLSESDKFDELSLAVSKAKAIMFLAMPSLGEDSQVSRENAVSALYSAFEILCQAYDQCGDGA